MDTTDVAVSLIKVAISLNKIINGMLFSVIIFVIYIVSLNLPT